MIKSQGRGGEWEREREKEKQREGDIESDSASKGRREERRGGGDWGKSFFVIQFFVGWIFFVSTLLMNSLPFSFYNIYTHMNAFNAFLSFYLYSLFCLVCVFCIFLSFAFISEFDDFLSQFWRYTQILHRRDMACFDVLWWNRKRIEFSLTYHELRMAYTHTHKYKHIYM